MAQSILSTNRSTASPTNKEDDINGDLYFHQVKLQQYIVQCAQNLEFTPNDKLQMAGGGLRDKPPMSADPYHTCYAMSGFSASQNLHYWNYKRIGNDNHNSNNTNYIYAALQKGYLPKRFTIEETKQYNQAYNQNVKHKHTEANKKMLSDLSVVLPSDGSLQRRDMCLLTSCNPIFNVNRAAIKNALLTFGPKTFLAN
ncbi:hypothetical protein ADEAN_000254200 [Angomonas deanei]|uniref:Prenyltransferase alpha-alpha toroid domain-containing protein n=1 Tax=Angomonas deanei TaxID=59799 RepID=A0A7G2C6A4_9TRYP|nr:hypothetical protein ADEAN_000254200 [Angomonas deanei]